MPSDNIAGLIYMYFHNTKNIGRTKNKLFSKMGHPMVTVILFQKRQVLPQAS